ncbi:hypothetical protein [Phytobacter diazotrophicus]|uniref:hypothetical protein n=1 Tax=Phytobacter diazotrophicus TaxID=395631 RepID=UPI002FF92D6A
MDEDNAGLILNAIGLVMVELVGERMPITRDNLVDKLEHNWRETGNVTGKGANRAVAELVRSGG